MPGPTPRRNSTWFEGMDTKILAGNLGQFFSDKIDRIREIITTSLQLSTSNFAVSSLFRTQTTLTRLSPVTAAEVKQLIQSALAKTSPTDVIPTSLLKVFIEEFSLMIAHVANVSFAAARFPSFMKLRQVTPLLKKPGLDKGDFKNFRPITNLTTILKIIERLALHRLRPQLASSPNYCIVQSAYCTGRSTETALVKVVNDILNHIETGSVVALVSLNISAAFDMVNHHTLKTRLEEEFGISDKALE